jgi:GT2 family glycosyltransferase
VHPGEVRSEFCTSLIAVALQGETRVDQVLALESGPNISTARNMVVREFLDNNQAPWLLMVDTDMVFSSTSLDRLIAAADPVERPIIGGLCFSLVNGETYPTMYELAETESGRPGFVRLSQWPEDACQRVTATGAAFLLMHRDALRKVEELTKDVSAPWFRETPVGAPLSLMGEDMTFCLRCAAAGIPIHVHTGVQVGHMKPAMLGKVV